MKLLRNLVMKMMMVMMMMMTAMVMMMVMMMMVIIMMMMKMMMMQLRMPHEALTRPAVDDHDGHNLDWNWW